MNFIRKDFWSLIVSTERRGGKKKKEREAKENNNSVKWFAAFMFCTPYAHMLAGSMAGGTLLMT